MFSKSIGIDFKIKNVEINGMKFKLQLWDTAGQERFRTITASYYRAAAGILLFCDMSNERSLETLEMWYNQVKANAPNARVVLVGTKNDIETKVPVDVMRVWANDRTLPFVSTSAKTGAGVEEAVLRLLKEIILLNEDDFGRKKEKDIAIVPANQDQGVKKAGCC